MKEILLTGDRPTGKLHLGHYVGTLRKRIELQNNDKYKQYVFMADMQALTDYAKKPEVIVENILEVALDYLAVGIDPKLTTIFIQSQIPELSELTMYLMNLVTIARLQRNPTIKEEIKQKQFGTSVPAGFLLYPISQAADILAFNTKFIPAGEDQEPIIEQTREIVRSFNSIYGEILIEPKILLPDQASSYRLPGIDGKAKMSKSLNNAIFLADSKEIVEQKVMKMYTDPNHLNINDPGVVEENTVFTYLDCFCHDEHFKNYLPEYLNLQQLKDHYRRGGLGDVKIKKFLNNILQELLQPIREKRAYYENRKDEVYKILEEGSKEARLVASNTLNKVRDAIGINYFK